MRRDGVPQFEPNLKAGGHWHARLTVPEDIRESGDRSIDVERVDRDKKSVTWVIEVASQILFSNTASVSYELLVGRDQRDLDVGFAAITSRGYGEPGKITDLVEFRAEASGQHIAPKGVYSGAIRLEVEDTAALWNKPSLPGWDEKTTKHETESHAHNDGDGKANCKEKVKVRATRPKKVHLVILTHGLHSNTGADMLYLKESIDATVKEARQDSRKRKASLRRREKESKNGKQPEKDQNSVDTETTATAEESQPSSEEPSDEQNEDDSDDEEVLVRGFPGNAVRTERGIQYLGKRLAKYILTFTYPDQPFLPPGKSMTRAFTGNFSNSGSKPIQQMPASHHGDSAHKTPKPGEQLPYKFSSISFIGHSLGGLVQTYAIAYIYKHSPGFFDNIRPANFITMAAPLLGLSNENPMYVKFALDFGLVGRTGQDLGLTWRPPTIARSGWSAMIAGFGNSGTEQQPKHADPRSKPLLRILPSGPAHQVLKMFRNRTAYSNVVNDGIVPLRTSCLLFLDWRGLDRVENARRENGLISTMAQFGWNELTGANTTSHRPKSIRSVDYSSSESDREADLEKIVSSTSISSTHASNMPKEATRTQSRNSPKAQEFLANRKGSPHLDAASSKSNSETSNALVSNSPSNALSDFLNLFRPAPAQSPSSKPQKVSGKMERAYRRAQVVKKEGNPASAFAIASGGKVPKFESQPSPDNTRSNSFQVDSSGMPPPKTSIFEAAGDIINPPIPTQEWLTNPASRTRTIFHDRIYHPEDIPPPPAKRSLLSRTISNETLKSPGSPHRQDTIEGGGMKVDEKIARAYHRDLSWRKVLVRLEPDAHNNMIVRRKFANAYGWEVVKHVCDTHFANTYEATTEDSNEKSEERAKPLDEPVTDKGEEVYAHAQQQGKPSKETRQARTVSELREATDELRELPPGSTTVCSSDNVDKGPSRQDSVVWTDDLFNENSEDESENETTGPFETFHRFWSPTLASKTSKARRRYSHRSDVRKPQMEVDPKRVAPDESMGTSESEIAAFLTKSPSSLEPKTGGDAVPPHSKTSHNDKQDANRMDEIEEATVS